MREKQKHRIFSFLDGLAGYLAVKVMLGFILWFYFRVWHGGKVRVIGRLPRGFKKCVFYSNHPSYVETMLGPTLWWPWCIWNSNLPYVPAAEENYFKPDCHGVPVLEKIPVIKDLPVFKWLMKHGNCIKVRAGREDPAALKEMVKIIRKGGSILIFPEGGRTRNGDLSEFRLGVCSLIMTAKPKHIIPIWVDGTNKILPIGERWLDWNKGKITIIIGTDITDKIIKAQKHEETPKGKRLHISEVLKKEVLNLREHIKK